MSTIDDARADKMIRAAGVMASENDRLRAEIARLQDQLAEQKEISVGLRCDNELLRIQLKQCQDQLATAREGQQRILKAWDDWYDGPETMIGGDMIEAILALKADAIPTSDRERRLEEARACKHGTWTIGLICVDCGQSRGKPDWTWYYDMVTF